jgi:hypothetical protein
MSRGFRIFGQMPQDQIDLRTMDYDDSVPRQPNDCRSCVGRTGTGLSRHEQRVRVGLASPLETGLHRLTAEVRAYKRSA